MEDESVVKRASSGRWKRRRRWWRRHPFLVVGVILVAVALGWGIAQGMRTREQSVHTAIYGNLMMLHSAVQQYDLERGLGPGGIAFDEVVGAGRYLREVRPVAGETYGEGFPMADVTVPLVARLGDGRVVVLWEKGRCGLYDGDGILEQVLSMPREASLPMTYP